MDAFRLVESIRLHFWHFRFLICAGAVQIVLHIGEKQVVTLCQSVAAVYKYG